VENNSARIEAQEAERLCSDLLELSDSQLAYVVVETTVVRHEKLWRVLGVVACLALLLSSSFVPMNTPFDPTIGLIALLVVAILLAYAAFLLRRKK
jgi:peptidoglycan/LPS O-acetylase OafA/YrhL